MLSYFYCKECAFGFYIEGVCDVTKCVICGADLKRCDEKNFKSVDDGCDDGVCKI